MRISLKWMTLTATVAILAPVLAANAQSTDLKLNVPQPASEISRDLQPESTHPNHKTTNIAVSASAEVDHTQPKVVKQSAPLIVSSKAKFEITPLKEISSHVYQPIASVKTEPDTISPVAMVRSQVLPVPQTSLQIPSNPKVAASDSTSNQAQTKLDPSSNSTPNTTPSNSTPKIATNNLEPIAPLVVPTTPGQVKIERTQPITLEEALVLANQKNRDIIQARIAVERARAVLQEAEAARNPTVNLQAGYNIQTRTAIRDFRTTVNSPLSGTIAANYNLFNSGFVDANIRGAENQLRIVETDLNRITQVVRLQIVTAYYNLQSSDETVRINQKSVENAQRSLADTSALERAGVGTRFDVLQSQVQLANAQQTLLTGQANQLVARRDLVRQLEYPSNLDLSAADPIAPASDWKLSLEDSILLALKNRAELDIRRLQREVARDRARASLARLGPQVNLTTNFNLANDFAQFSNSSTFGYSVGANFSMALFDGGVANAQVDQSKADEALAESQFEQSANQARFDVEQAYINLQSRRGQISSSTQAVEQSTEALRLARLRLSAGVGTQLEVIRAEEDLTRSDVNRLQAVIGFNQSLANLQRAINGI